MRTKLRSKAALLFMTLGLLLAVPAIALADVINDDIADDTTTPLALVKGDANSTATAEVQVVGTGGDGDAGCNFDTAAESLTISFNTPTGVTATALDGATATAGEMKFTACLTKQTVQFQASNAATAGNYTVTATVVTNATNGSYNNNVNIPITVSNPPKAATSLDLVADPNEAYYGDPVDLTATLTKTSDSSAISGKTIGFKEGTTALCDADSGTPQPACPQTDANGEATLQVSNLSVGSHTITASFAEDNDYLGSSDTATVNILAWTLNGFFSPVDMDSGTTALNTVKGGSTVPLKFEVSKGATELTNTSAIKSFSTKAVTCPGADVAVDEIEFLTTGGTSLRYDTTAGQFIQNWATPKKVGCHDVTMETQDGSKLVAHFKLR